MRPMNHACILLATAAAGLFIFAGCGGDTNDLGVPNPCSSERASLLQAEEGSTSPTIATVPFEVLGASSFGDAFELQGTFVGVAQRDTPIEFDCFEGATQMGLTCSTDQVLQFEQVSDGGPSPVIGVATAVPVSDLRLPATGTAVNVIVDRNEPSSLVVRRRQSQDDNLVFAQNVIRGDTQTGGPESFDSVFGPFNLTMEANYSDASTATCLTGDPCPRLYRLEPLTFGADSTIEVQTAARGSVDGVGFGVGHNCGLGVGRKALWVSARNAVP